MALGNTRNITDNLAGKTANRNSATISVQDLEKKKIDRKDAVTMRYYKLQE